jgi:hypothetical protein
MLRQLCSVNLQRENQQFCTAGRSEPETVKHIEARVKHEETPIYLRKNKTDVRGA